MATIARMTAARHGLGFGVWGLGFGVWGLGFGVWGLEFGIWGLGFGVYQLLLRRIKARPRLLTGRLLAG